jgi:hypothetical protein
MHFQRFAFHRQPAFRQAPGVLGLARARAARRAMRVPATHVPPMTRPKHRINTDLRMYLPFASLLRL